MATGAAIGGRAGEFEAAAGVLDQNSVALSMAIGSVYGKPAEDAFLPLWRKHIGFFVDYTQGAAAKDEAKKSKALADLTAYARDFDAFLTGANPNLPQGAVAELLGPHVMTLTKAIDAQAAGDAKAFEHLRMAAEHMPHIADPLAAAIVKQFPDKFAGSSDSKAAGLRAGLNGLLQEHVYLAGMATGAATGGRDAEFQAAAGALDMNSVALSKAIGSVYGTAAEEAFLPLWRKHIGFFVDYTQGAASKDQAKKDKAVADLTAYAKDFDAFLTGANPNLPMGAVQELLGPHVMTLAKVVDAQAAGDTKSFGYLREAAAHMPHIADALAEAIVKQFPEMFADGDSMTPGGTQSMTPTTMAPSAGSVSIQVFQYQPSPLEVKVGTEVTWTNMDNVEHTVTHGSPGAKGGAFDSGLMNMNGTFSYTPTEAGTLSYFCERHESMRGELRVVN
jgi:plastocyanin